MKNPPPIVTVLCRVIDNYGDIGVVYRLLRALSDVNEQSRVPYFSHLRLVVDDLASFARLAPGIDETKNVQSYNGWTVYRHDCTKADTSAVTDEAARTTKPRAEAEPKTDELARTTKTRDTIDTNSATPTEDASDTAPTADAKNTVVLTPTTCAEDASINEDAVRDFTKEPSTVIIEAFACGKPLWLENLIFNPQNGARTLLINLEYLTAEPYADEFHLQKALTRAATVQKYFFMPGFTAKTGGLILDDAFCKSLSRTKDASARRAGSTAKDASCAPDAASSHVPSAPDVAPAAHDSSAKDAWQNRAPTMQYHSNDATIHNAPYCAPAAHDASAFTVTVFTYEHDFSPIVRALALFQTNRRTTNKAFSLTVNLANGRGADSFCTAYDASVIHDTLAPLDASKGNDASSSLVPSAPAVASTAHIAYSARDASEAPVSPALHDAPAQHVPAAALDASTVNDGSVPFKLVKLPFMSQTEWDAVLCGADFLFVRGEDTLSRACLIGVPFVWHAYPQSENYQLVKVRALLDVMRPHFSADDFDALSRYWLWFNGEESPETIDSSALLSHLLSRYDSLHKSFDSFAKILLKNGNLALHLMTFIAKMR